MLATNTFMHSAFPLFEWRQIKWMMKLWMMKQWGVVFFFKTTHLALATQTR